METTATAGVEEAGVAKPEDRQGKDEEVVTKQDNQGEQENDENGEVNADEDRGYDEMESMCMACGENGTTRLLMHKVPHFRELILASFYCEHCGERNNEVTFGGEIQIHGCQIELLVTKASDLDRQLVKSDSATIRLPDIEFEIPPKTQKGEISTIEGFLKTAAKNLGLYQRERMAQYPEIGSKVAEVITALTMYSAGVNLPFRICVDDPSGNSFIQNPYAPGPDPNMKQAFYYRTPEQDMELGLAPNKPVFKDDKDSNFLGLVDKFATPSAAITEDEEGNVRLGRSEVVQARNVQSNRLTFAL
jgi:ZPR1 zinc finger protein